MLTALLALAALGADDGHQARPGEDQISLTLGTATRDGARVTGASASWERGLRPSLSAALSGSWIAGNAVVRLEGRWSPLDPDGTGPAFEVFAGGGAVVRPGGWQAVAGVRGGWQLGALRPYGSAELAPSWLRDGQGQTIWWTRYSGGLSWRREHPGGSWAAGLAADLWTVEPDPGGPLTGAHVWFTASFHTLDPVSEGTEGVAWQDLLPPPDPEASLKPDGVFRCEAPIRGYLVFYGVSDASWISGDMAPEDFWEWLDRRGEDMEARRVQVTRDGDIHRIYTDASWWMMRPIGDGLAVVRVRGTDPRETTCTLVER